MNEFVEYEPEYECAWCGGDLTDIMETEGVSFDTALEAHVEECDIYIEEQGL